MKTNLKPIDQEPAEFVVTVHAQQDPSKSNSATKRDRSPKWTSTGSCSAACAEAHAAAVNTHTLVNIGLTFSRDASLHVSTSPSRAPLATCHR